MQQRQTIDQGDWDCGGSYIHLFNSSSPDQSLYVQTGCGKLYCSDCERRRQRDLLRRIEEHTKHNWSPRWWFITSSVRNTFTASAAWNTYQATWKQYLDASRYTDHPWQSIDQWIGVREVTLKDRGWNFHTHMLVASSSKRLDYTQMIQSWEQAAGYKAHFHIKKMWNSKGAMAYLSKYSATKKGVFWGGLTQLQAFRYQNFLKGKNRIVRSRGSKPPHTTKGYIMCCPTNHRGECNRF